LADACRQTGLKLGLYLSPWDMHEPTYGDSPKYNEYFKNQLRELLTNYGEVAEVWFDGACGEGPNGKRQVYDWEGYYKVIRELQPNAVIAIMGSDVRWVGNEKGYARLSEWSVLPLTAQDQTIIAEHSQKIDGFVPKDKRDKDLGSREKIFQAEHLVWYPAEADVSIRPGWYYHPEQDDQVKSIRDLLDIYYASVGRNSVLLLNLPPDKRGLIHENDAKRVFELCKVLDATFDQNLALNVNVKANQVRQNNSEFYPENIVDDNKDTYWSTDDWTTTAEIVFDLGQNRTFNRAMLQEYIKVGQRVEEFVLQAWSDEQWKTFAKGTTVGYKRLLRFEDMTTRKVRLLINQSRVCPTLSNFGLYYQPPLDEILGS
jgi:alpha-L-fucosidase